MAHYSIAADMIECPDGDWVSIEDHKAALETARNDALRQAAYMARHACLVPPDGGSPSEAEAELCDEAERRILTLVKKECHD